MANLGDQFQTGEHAPVSGVYHYVQSIADDCTLPPKAMDVPLHRGEPLPSHPQCRGAVTWELVSQLD
jgi:hypothetical protein